MVIYRIKPASLPNGQFAAEWFDDAAFLWDDERLRKREGLLEKWESPNLQLRDPSLTPTPVLFNPNALAVSVTVRNQLAIFTEIEFLPINIAGHGTFYILHLLASEEIPTNSSVFQAPSPSGNVVNIYTLPSSFEPVSALFRMTQPKESAAGRAGSCVRGIFASAHGAKALLSACTGFLLVDEVKHA
jgi:hypothetical protein